MNLSYFDFDRIRWLRHEIMLIESILGDGADDLLGEDIERI